MIISEFPMLLTHDFIRPVIRCLLLVFTIINRPHTFNVGEIKNKTAHVRIQPLLVQRRRNAQFKAILK
jgi:hypothetical protein